MKKQEKVYSKLLIGSLPYLGTHYQVNEKHSQLDKKDHCAFGAMSGFVGSGIQIEYKE